MFDFRILPSLKLVKSLVISWNLFAWEHIFIDQEMKSYMYLHLPLALVNLLFLVPTIPSLVLSWQILLFWYAFLPTFDNSA